MASSMAEAFAKAYDGFTAVAEAHELALANCEPMSLNPVDSPKEIWRTDGFVEPKARTMELCSKGIDAAKYRAGQWLRYNPAAELRLSLTHTDRMGHPVFTLEVC